MKTVLSTVQCRLTGWLLGMALTVASGAVSAAILLEQLPDMSGDAYSSYLDSGQMLAEDFTLGSAVDLDGIGWWGSFVADDDLDNFHVALFSNLANPPLADLTGTAITRSDAGNDVYQYQLSTPLSLAAGSYFLAVVSDSAEWYWQRALTGNGIFWYFQDGNSGWESSGEGDPPTQADLALRLTGQLQQSVPEPGSLGLLLAAGAALVVARRRA